MSHNTMAFMLFNQFVGAYPNNKIDIWKRQLRLSQLKGMSLRWDVNAVGQDLVVTIHSPKVKEIVDS